MTAAGAAATGLGALALLALAGCGAVRSAGSPPVRPSARSAAATSRSAAAPRAASRSTGSAPPGQPGAAPIACGVAPTSSPTPRAYPSEPPAAIEPAGRYVMTLQTSCGPMVVNLDTGRAPRAVNTLVFLADHHFYDATTCNREVNTAAVALVQCGDPTGTGSGGPGFTLPEEHLAGSSYPPGTMAMARTSATHSTGSQFFLVGSGGGIPPRYTVVGHLSAGMAVLRRLLAVGNDGAFGAGDGAPAQTIYLLTVRVRRLPAGGPAG